MRGSQTECRSLTSFCCSSDRLRTFAFEALLLLDCLYDGGPENEVPLVPQDHRRPRLKRELVALELLSESRSELLRCSIRQARVGLSVVSPLGDHELLAPEPPLRLRHDLIDAVACSHNSHRCLLLSSFGHIALHTSFL